MSMTFLTTEEKQDIIEKAEHCFECGNTETLLVHHKNRNKTDNRPENLVVLCRDCHGLEHPSRKPQVGEVWRLSASIPVELHDWLREYAFKTRKSQGEIIREALTQYRESHTYREALERVKQARKAIKEA
jgi:cytochrome c553